jgi:Ca2+-binding EF-hand superfamily protein
MSARTLCLFLATMAVPAPTLLSQESRPDSRPVGDAERELVQDFRIWAMDHPEAAAKLKARMDRNGDGKVDDNERARALEILGERRAEMRAWIEARPRPAPGPGDGDSAKALRERADKDEKEQERARKLFDSVDRNDDGKIQPKERVQARRTIQRVDRNDDGKLDPKERIQARKALERGDRGDPGRNENKEGPPEGGGGPGSGGPERNRPPTPPRPPKR